MAVQRDHPRAHPLVGVTRNKGFNGFFGRPKIGTGYDRIIYGREILGGGVHDRDVEQS